LKRVREGKLPLLSMPIRVDDRPLPLASIVDRKQSALRKEGPRLIGPELALALRETLARGEQSILYLNRRGHARTLLCTACGATVACPNCDVALVLHQSGGARLVCHFCGHHEPERSECVACGNRELLPLSGGTERLEEELATVVPSAWPASIATPRGRRAPPPRCSPATRAANWTCWSARRWSPRATTSPASRWWASSTPTAR
jgi:primosomal protein N' (replication factor Y)